MTRTDAEVLPIRRGMDVYRFGDGRYLGCVVTVTLGDEGNHGPDAGGDNPTGSEQAPPNAAITHEEGQQAGTTTNRGRHVLGEELGPAPTMAAGNQGPVEQSAAHEYATTPSPQIHAVCSFRVRPGRINLGPLARSFQAPVAALRSISMERIVLDLPDGQIPSEWWG